MIGHPKLTLDGTINSVQVLLKLLGEPMNAYGLKRARNWSLDCMYFVLSHPGFVSLPTSFWGVFSCFEEVRFN